VDKGFDKDIGWDKIKDREKKIYGDK